MKKYLIILFIVIPSLLLAKLEEKEGYFITNEGDTVFGTIKIRFDYKDDIYFARVQYGIFHQDSTGALNLLRPNDIKEFGFHHGYQDHKFVSVEYFKNYYMFLHVINDEGAVKLYVHYKDMFDSRTDYGNLSYFLLSYPTTSEKDYFYMVKPDSSTIKYSKYSGRKRLAEFFSDYPELQSKIERGLYKYTAVYRMVREYNKWYKKNPMGKKS
ncbi:MAG: hypothetical protein K8S16_11580 [Bacteroidales bacterium]|nr:hypothetical protein [Bacteroidales bacterium]